MLRRHFRRRGFAYFLDLLISSFAITAVVLLLNSILSLNIIAPELVKSRSCSIVTGLVSPERMTELLPLKQGQQHRQILCEQKNMFATTHNLAVLQKYWKTGNTNNSIHITYPIDKSGNLNSYFPIDPILYLLAPFIFALSLSIWGQTPGKWLLDLKVYGDNRKKPTLKASLKREYFKAVIFVGLSILALYTYYQGVTLDLDAEAQKLREIEADLSVGNINNTVNVNVLISIASFIFLFGSFIRWTGRTFWDHFAKLTTSTVEEFNLNSPENTPSQPIPPI